MLDPSESTIERFLESAREELGMDVAFMAQFVDGKEVFRAVAGDGPTFGVEEGGSRPLDETICQRVATSRAPNVIPDAKEEEALRDLGVVDDAGIGCYVGIPIRFSDGRLYGTFCCLAHGPDPTLRERDVAFMHVFARLIGDQLERDELAAENQRLQLTTTAVEALLTALAARDGYTGEHSREVVALSVAVAREMGLADEEVAEIEQVALLHDIGKIAIPDAILRKPSPLSSEEWELMRTHPVAGASIVSSIDSLAHLAPAIRAEHERWDGRGYPDGLAGDEIPLASRIVLACDAYDAITSDRPYRRALDAATARGELLQNRGAQFCPKTVDALLAVLERPVPTGAG